jgi:hypothetical protein
MGSIPGSLIAALAAGPTPVKAPDILQSVTAPQQAAAQVLGARAQLAEARAGTQEKQALTAQAQAQTAGINVENQLKQRSLDAKKTLGSLLQQNTVKNPDGSVSTNMGNVLGQYRSQYPEFALELEKQQLDLENQRATAAKNEFELKSAQTKHLGFQAAALGLDKPDFAQDPSAVSKYQALYNAAQQNGTAQFLPASPAEFARNPAAYASKIAQFTQQSGGLSEALTQKAATIDQNQKQVGQARTFFAQQLAQAKTPQDYAKAYQQTQQQFGDVFPAMNLPAPNTVQNSHDLSMAASAAQLSQMAPHEAAEYVEKVKQDTRIAAVEQQKANAETMKARASQAEAGAAIQGAKIKALEFGQQYGVDVNGKPLPPQLGGGLASGGPSTLNVPQADGSSKKLDLGTFGPWKAASPLVQQTALAYLTGKNVPSRDSKDPIAVRAYNLASQVDPQFQDRAQARGKFLNDSTPLISNANTAIQHSQDLLEKIDKVGTGNLKVMNRLTLLKNLETGKPAPSELEAVRDQYAAEIQKYFNGGTFTQGEYEKALDNLASSNSPAALKGVIKSTNKMLAQGLGVRAKEYNETLGGNITGGGVSFMQPESKAILDKQGVATGAAAKVATMDHVKAYANKYLNGDIGKAKKLFADDGVTIK